MRIISDITGKEYKTVEECLADEKKFEKKVKTEKEQKKELAKLVEKAEKEVDIQLKNYELAKEKVRDILDKSNKEADLVLTAAEKDLKDAYNKKTEAIKEFNNRFGVYTTTVTDLDVLEELNRFLTLFGMLF